MLKGLLLPVTNPGRGSVMATPCAVAAAGANANAKSKSVLYIVFIVAILETKYRELFGLGFREL